MALLSNNLNKSGTPDNRISFKDDHVDDGKELPGTEGD